MSKVKQIYEILFPHGITRTYVPAVAATLLTTSVIAMYFISEPNSFALMIDCIALALNIKLFVMTYKHRQTMAAHERLFKEVMKAVGPELEKNKTETFDKMTGIDPDALIDMMERMRKVTQAEFDRRKNLANVSSSDKT